MEGAGNFSVGTNRKIIRKDKNMSEPSPKPVQEKVQGWGYDAGGGGTGARL